VNKAAACYASKEVDVMSNDQEHGHLKVDQLEVGKHVKIRSPLGGIDVHASETSLGVWMTPAGVKTPEQSLSIHIQRGVPPAICIWPSFKSKYPFAISANGLQVVKEDGTTRILPLARIAEIVDKLMSDS
jgi:hypothetical protein